MNGVKDNNLRWSKNSFKSIKCTKKPHLYQMVFVGKAFLASIGLWKGKVQIATIDKEMYWKTSIEYPMERTKKSHLYQRVFIGKVSSASIGLWKGKAQNTTIYW